MAAPTLEILLKLKDQASTQLKTAGKSWEDYKKQIMAAGVAMAAIGAIGLKFISQARELNATLGMTGITLGVSTEGMRKLALGITNVTFPLKSVAATFELLARAGIRNTEQIKVTALAFDALADATGSNAEIVAEILIPAYKVFGLTLPTTSKEMDKFTWLVKNTMVDLSDFAGVMQYVAREGAGLGVTLEDMIAIMAALESRGIMGSAATMKFRMAISEAVSEGKSLNDVLGITQTEIDTYRSKLGDAIGMTDKYAEVAATQFGIMAQLKQKFGEVALSIGSFLEPLEPLTFAMTLLGGVSLFLSSALGKVAIGFIASAAAAIKAAISWTIAAIAGIWAAYGWMPFVGIGLALGAIAALTVTILAIKGKFAGLAEGGIVTRPTMALIGERGPEAVVPLGRGAGNVVVNVDVRGSVIAERDLAQVIRREILHIKTRNVTTGL